MVEDGAGRRCRLCGFCICEVIVYATDFYYGVWEKIEAGERKNMCGLVLLIEAEIAVAEDRLAKQ